MSFRRRSERYRRSALAPSLQTLHYGDSGRKYSSSAKECEETGLTNKQIQAFHEVFNLFDINGGGTIDANELDSALKSVDIQLTRREIEDVLHVIDEDGNGEIDFEEFLTLMTSTEKYIATLKGQNEDGKQGAVFFAALTKFMKTSALSSLSEIERYYNNKVRKAPHVVGHYAAGARLIGLTEREMAKRFATLSVGSKEADSPYAQPVVGIFLNKQKALRMTGKIKLKVNKSLDVRTEDGTGTEDKVTNLPKIRSDSSGIPSSSVTNIPICTNTSSITRARVSKSAPKPRMLNFSMPGVPLPAVSSLSKEPSALTIEDLPAIRSKVNSAYSEYRHKLHTKKENINGHHLEQMDIGNIPSKMLRTHFLRIAEAYGFSPSDFSTRPRLHPWNIVGSRKPAITAPGVYAH